MSGHPRSTSIAGHSGISPLVSGPHRCLGSHLARVELAVALEEWHKRIPNYRIAEGEPIVEHHSGVYGLNNLPLTWA